MICFFKQQGFTENLALINTGRIRRSGSKNSKLIFVLLHGTELKSRPIPPPPPLQGGQNLCKAKWRGAGQTRRAKLLSLHRSLKNSAPSLNSWWGSNVGEQLGLHGFFEGINLQQHFKNSYSIVLFINGNHITI